MYPADDRELRTRLLARDVRDLAEQVLALAQERRRLLQERRMDPRLAPVSRADSSESESES